MIGKGFMLFRKILSFILVISFFSVFTYCAKEQEETSPSSSSSSTSSSSTESSSTTTSSEQPVTGEKVAYIDTTSSRADQHSYVVLIAGTYSSDNGFTQLGSYTFNLSTGATFATLQFDPYQRPMAMSPNGSNMIVTFFQEFPGSTYTTDIYFVDLSDLSSITPTKIISINGDSNTYVVYSSDALAYVLYQEKNAFWTAYIVDTTVPTVTGTYSINLTSFYSEIALDPSDAFTGSTGSFDGDINLSVIPANATNMGIVAYMSRFSMYMDGTSLSLNGTSTFKESIRSKIKSYRMILATNGYDVQEISNVIDLQTTGMGVISLSSGVYTLEITSADGFAAYGSQILSNNNMSYYLVPAFGVSIVTGSITSTSMDDLFFRLMKWNAKWYKIASDFNTTDITPAPLGTTSISCTVSGSPTSVEAVLLPMPFAWAPFNNIYFIGQPLMMGFDENECNISSYKVYAYNPTWPTGHSGTYVFDVPKDPPMGVDRFGRLYVKLNGSLTLPYD